MQRGLESRHEQDPLNLIRDTRTFGQKLADFLSDPQKAAVVYAMIAVSMVLLPGVADLLLIPVIVLAIFSLTRKSTLPFRMPLRSKALDYNDPLPGSQKPRAARGICFFGNDRKTNEEIWFNNDDMRTHALIFGSTGSGKTEALVSIAFNALVQSSGFIYVDGKGDNSLFAKVFSMVRGMGREDDLLLINFMTGARDITGAQTKRLSNTMNPFAIGSSSMLSQLVVSLMDSGGGGSSDGDMWKGRAIVFVEAVMKVLTRMRDDGHILLDANTIRNYFLLERLEDIAIDKSFPRDGGLEPVKIDYVPEATLEPIYNYVINLPGYDKSKKGQQSSQVLEQHGFITMQLTRVFGSLADTYSHIIRTNLAEVDLKDVVLNRRILVALLPALEKSPEELSNLGKVIIATLKAMMASGLGSDVEGDYRDVVERKPTNAPTPYLCILDEYGYYAVPGFAVVPAQARSLGFSVIFAGQDLPAFQKASKEEAASIGANTNIKICMKLEDPQETWEFFSKTAGESSVSVVSGFQTNASSISNAYLDSKNAQIEKRARIDLLDLKDQREGEAHVFFKSKICRAKMFFANPPAVSELRVNQFLKVERPEVADLVNLQKEMERFKVGLTQEDPFADVAVENPEVDIVADALADKNSGPIERGVSALLAYHNRTQPELEEEDEVESDDMMSVFTQMRLDPSDEALIKTDDLYSFKQGVLSRAQIRQAIQTVERLSGKSDKHASNIAAEIVKDMQLATQYPPRLDELEGSTVLASDLREVISYLASMSSDFDL